MRWSTSCSSMRSTATVMIVPALTVHIMGTVLGDAFDSVRKVQWAAASFCYTFVGVDAHCLGALILMLLGTATTNLDRSFTHSLRTVCPQAAPATTGDGPAVWTARRPCVTLAEKLEAAEKQGIPRVQ